MLRTPSRFRAGVFLFNAFFCGIYGLEVSMGKWICADELRSGDKFQYEDLTLETTGVTPVFRTCGDCGHKTRPMLNVGVPGGTLAIPPRSVVRLIHRPYPKDRTRQDMLDAIAGAAHQVSLILDRSSAQPIEHHLTDPSQALVKLRKAIEAYELGLPGNM